jgi:hypothetical protein
MLAVEIATAERALAEESSEGKRAVPVAKTRTRKPWLPLAAIGVTLAAATSIVSWRVNHQNRHDAMAVPAPHREVEAPVPAPPVRAKAIVQPSVPPAPTPEPAEPSAKAKPRSPIARRPDLAPAAAVESAAPRADELLDKAEMSFDRGEVTSALTFARASAKARPSTRAHLMAGRILLSDGKLAEAEAELTEAVRLAPPDDRTALQLLERVRARRQRGAQ